MIRGKASLGATIFFIFSASWGTPTYGKGSLDLSLTGATRTYPFGGAVEADFGGNFLLWGSEPKKSQEGSTNPWYGYTRLGGQLATAGSYNAAQVRAELFPISFLGFRAGVETYENDKDYSAYDCDVHLCQGRFQKEFGSVHLALGAKGIFLLGSWRKSEIKKMDDVGLFVEPSSGLAAESEGDSLERIRGILGYQFSNAWKIAAVSMHWKMRESETYSRSSTLNLGYSMGNWSVFVGGGVFESELKEKGTTANGVLSWNIKPSYALF